MESWDYAFRAVFVPQKAANILCCVFLYCGEIGISPDGVGKVHAVEVCSHKSHRFYCRAIFRNGTSGKLDCVDVAARAFDKDAVSVPYGDYLAGKSPSFQRRYVFWIRESDGDDFGDVKRIGRCRMDDLYVTEI